jgi:hypothetical protein
MDRRTYLRTLIASTALGGLAGCTNGGEGNTPKAQVNYQAHPKRGQQCSECQYYLSGKYGDSAGGCEQVAGKIVPDGWCQLYTPQS